MRYKKVLFLILITMFFSGCIGEEIASRINKVDVMNVNVTVSLKDNVTMITSIEAKNAKLSEMYAPGHTFPEKFPAIYVEIFQAYNISQKKGPMKTVSYVNGHSYNGTGNYTFTVQLVEESINKSQPFYINSRIVDNISNRLADGIIVTNWTE